MVLWGLALPALAAFAYFEQWYPFYFLASGATFHYSLFPLRPGRGRQHVIGAFVMFMSLLASISAQDIFNDKAPLIAHQAIDGFIGAVFLGITIQRRAIWSALCVAVHAGMAVLTYYQYNYNVYSDTEYLVRLNLLFLLALLVINVAIFTGRQAVGEAIDGFIVRRLRGWTFTGLRLPRLYSHRAKA